PARDRQKARRLPQRGATRRAPGAESRSPENSPAVARWSRAPHRASDGHAGRSGSDGRRGRTVLALPREREQLADVPVCTRYFLVGHHARGRDLAFAQVLVVVVEPLLEGFPFLGMALLEDDLLHCLPIR